MDFQQLEDNIKQYLYLEDKGIVKLLCAVTIANRIPSLDPTWLFVVSSSSGGKSELLLALAHAEGMVEQDDLTSKAFISGAKNGAKETSLIFRLPRFAIMIIKDLTVLLRKDSHEAEQIFSQLRMIYDGKIIKSFGTGEDINAPVRMGLIAGVTSVIEDTQADDAAVGQRAVKYYMKQPGDADINELTEKVLAGKQDKKMRIMIGESFKEYLDDPKWNYEYRDVPDLSSAIIKDIALLSDMSTKARSSIKRKMYSRDNPIERKNLREMPFRMAKQLANIAIAMMIMNDGELTGLDNRILYQITLDSIPSSRKEVMMAATKFEQVTLEGLAIEMKLPNESAKIHLDDLVALDIMTRSRGIDNKSRFELKSKYRNLIAKFEGIEMSDKVLDETVDIPLPPEPMEFQQAPDLINTEDLASLL